MNRKRRLAYFSACNIDGNTMPRTAVTRSGDFREDPAVDNAHQTGEAFYDHGNVNSLLDKGHLTKYEDVLWGEHDEEVFRKIGADTFWYTNCVPQHRTLNRGMWRSLENYILNQETEELKLRISVFTGPVFLANDPFLNEPVKGITYQLPTLFWKIIVFMFSGKPHAIAFMMSQQSLLRESGLIRRRRMLDRLETWVKERTEPAFMDYKHSNPYQVRVEDLLKLNKMTLEVDGLVLPYQKHQPMELKFNEVDIDRRLEGFGLDASGPKYEIPNLVMF